MCCDPVGTEDEIVGECPECGSNIDRNGYSDDVCRYSPMICDLCGCAPCDQSC